MSLDCGEAALWRVMLFLALLAPAGQSQQSKGRASAASEPETCAEEAPNGFLTWAGKNSIPLSTTEPGRGFRDLEPLRKVVGDARIVGLGEAARKVHEFYQVRHRLLEFLVEEEGFTAFAMETGFAEAIKINDYVLGRIGEPKRWQEWFTLGFGDENELQALVRWMRQYNQDPQHKRKIHFYGIDDMVPYSSPLTAINAAFAYLDNADPSFLASQTRKDLLSLVQKFLGSGGSRQDMEVSFRKYAKLSSGERNAYTADVAGLMARFETNRAGLVSRSSAEAYEWAYHAAVAARQLDTSYRAAVAATKPNQPMTGDAFAVAIWTSRDRAMMENVSWALDREGTSGRIVLWAHNAHLSKGSVPSTRSDVIGLWERGPRLGLLLDSMLGPKYVSIGTAFYEGQPGGQATREPAKCGTVDGELARLGAARFILDLRSARQDKTTYEWLNSSRLMHADNAGADYRVNPSQAWDALLFIRHISPVQVSPP